MKTIYLFLLMALCLNIDLQTNAQGIYQYWGTTEVGADENQGTAYTTRMDGGGHKMRQAMPIITPGGSGHGKNGVVYNNKIYTVAGGGLDEVGIIMAYDPANSSYEKLANLYSIGGHTVYTTLVIYNNLMYGISGSEEGGGDGFIFEFNPTNNALVRKFNFSTTDYRFPRGGLTLIGDELWGCATEGDIAIRGGIFSYDLGSGVFTERSDFGNFLGTYPYSAMSTYNNKLYGVTSGGGANGMGVLFEYNPATDIYTVRHVFSGGNDGNSSRTQLTLFNNKFYGQTWEEGANGMGTIFEFDPATNIYTTKYQNTTTNGGRNESGFTAYNNKLYCLNRLGGTDGDGTLIEYDPIGNTVVKKVDCSPSSGNNGVYILTLYNNRFYGLAEGGIYAGLAETGVYFEYNPGPNSMVVKILFKQNEGVVPTGNVTYANGKVFGITRNGGNDENGVIWEYDLATYTYTVRHHFTNMRPQFTYGMTLHNGKLYGGTIDGGTHDDGVFYSFDPVTYQFTILHSFESASEGTGPRSQPVLFNGKLYGTCSYSGPGGGSIWEYNPATNDFAIKVLFSQVSMGSIPFGNLVELNGSLWGVCNLGGVNNRGTIYQYFPAINGIIKRHDFEDPSSSPEGGLVAANNKLYGTVAYGNDLFEFNPASGTYTIVADLFDAGSYIVRSNLTFNEKTQKIYGTSHFGGSYGTIFEYDLANDVIERTLQFNPTIGAGPNNGGLVKTPAFVAPGNPGSCAPGGSANVDPSNWNEWIPFTNTNGDAVVEINPNGNNLGRVMVNFYVHDGATRQKNGFYYLDRNITITSDNQPVTPVSVRLYIRKTEFEKLKNTAGSGIVSIGNLSVFKNSDPCSNIMTGSAQMLPTSVTSWGGDHVFITSVSSFSTFYFASSLAVLPVQLLSLNGTKEATANKLSWNASCDNPVEFTVERSTDGTSFTGIGAVSGQDCNPPFQFLDPNPPAKAWYRLKMTELNSVSRYSNLILINRLRSEAFDVSIFPNPVTDGTANLQVNSNKKMSMLFTISDAMGRIVMKRSVNVIEGTNSFALPVGQFATGIYQLVYHDGEKNNTVRFIKQ